MTDPSLDRAEVIVDQLSNSVRRLTDEVIHSEALRASKIRLIQKAMFVMIPAVILLLLLTFTNFVLLAKISDTATSAKNTNDLLVSCFQPSTPCSTTSQQRTGEALEQLRQTQFVIAICQRQNTIADDPNGLKVVKCVQSYYPQFTLPPHAK